jgi:two-component system, cell cycle sensor histidine kinase and response regulator CckA
VPGRSQSAEAILVVEDAEAVRKMVCAMLTQIGYICLEAADGAEALRVLNGSKQVRLVLTDVMMPNMGGAELAQHLARIRPDVRIIFMSGYADHPVIHCLGAETAEFLAKPFTASALTDTVRRVLNNGGPASHPG